MSEPVAIDSALKELRAGRLPRLGVVPRDLDREERPAAVSSTLIQDLIAEFGLGGSPQLRRTLYERLARLELLHGASFGNLLAEARSLARAPGIRNKGNYFARAICLKIREGGLQELPTSST